MVGYFFDLQWVSAVVSRVQASVMILSLVSDLVVFFVCCLGFMGFVLFVFCEFAISGGS